MKYLAVVSATLIVIMVGLFPLLQHLTTHLTSPDDGPLIAWFIHHDTEFILGRAPLYDLPFFYPYKNTLAYSDPFLSTGVFNVFVSHFTDNLILQSNIHIILGTIFCFVGMYLLAYELVEEQLAAWTAAFIFEFSFLHFLFIVHLHTYLVAGLPFAVYFLLRYSKTKKLLYLILVDLSFLYQALNAPMTAYFLATIFVCLLINRSIRTVIFRDKVVWIHAASVFLLCCAFYLPYFQVSHEFQMTRTIRDAAHFSDPISRLWDWDFIVLIGISLFLWFWPKKYKPFQLSGWTWLIICIIGAVFTLGPVIKYGDHTVKIFHQAIPLPYAIAYYLIPGMNAFRSVTRWNVLTAFGSGLGVAYLLVRSKLPKIWKYAIVGLIVISLLAIDVSRLPLFQIAAAPPPIYSVVKGRPENILAELPGYLWDMSPYASNLDEEMLYQAYHGKTLFLGDSGLTPPQLQVELVKIFNEFPSDDTVHILKDHQVELLLMHYGVFNQMYGDHAQFRGVPSRDPNQMRRDLEARTDIQPITCLQDDCLYRLTQ